jgi:hypothetical protein
MPKILEARFFDSTQGMMRKRALLTYIPRIRIGLFSDFLFSQHIVLTTNCDIPCLSSDCRFRKSYGVIVPKSTYGSAKT